MNEMTNGINTSRETKEKQRAENLIKALKGKKVTILGHDNIDVDAALSGILMSKLLNFLKIENQFCILEPVKKDETYEIIMELLGIDIKEWQKEEPEEAQDLLLVDHYVTKHKGHVIACIDHHPTQQKIDYDFMYVRNSSATAYLIYEIMKEVNFPIEEDVAKMILVSMMVDTTSFRSTKTIPEEVEQAKLLASQYQLDYNFLEKYCLCLTKIDELSVEEIIVNGQKWYNYNGRRVGSSYLQLYGMPDKKQLKEWLEALRDKQWESDSDMLVFIIFETKDNKTYEYQVMSNCIKSITITGILSRGKNIMPLIEARYLDEMNTERKTIEFVKKLSKKHETIATMESCTGGELASTITSVEGASEVLKESYVSYCNEAKIKFGVPKNTIEQYTVYSAETAIAMARAVSKLANSDFGIGITGQLGRIDPNNLGCENNEAWYAIKQNEKEAVYKISIFGNFSRSEKKEIVIKEIMESLHRW